VSGVDVREASDLSEIESRILIELETTLELVRLVRDGRSSLNAEKDWMSEVRNALEDPVAWATLLAWVFARHLGEIGMTEDGLATPRLRFHSWHFDSTLVDLVIALGHSEEVGRRTAETVEMMIGPADSSTENEVSVEELGSPLADLVGSDLGRRYLRVNEHAAVLWFNREAFAELLLWQTLTRVLEGIAEDSESARAIVSESASMSKIAIEMAEDAGFRLIDFLETLHRANDNVAADD
jgi:hypothetical protein